MKRDKYVKYDEVEQKMALKDEVAKKNNVLKIEIENCHTTFDLELKMYRKRLV